MCVFKKQGEESMEHLADVTKISGPVSAHVFRMSSKDGASDATIYLFGDVHFSYDNRCTKCSAAKGCYSVVDFIEGVVAGAGRSNSGGYQVDVFFELPYVPADPHLRTGLVEWVDTLFTRNASVGNMLSNVVKKAMGRSPEYIGMFSKLYRKFGQRTYHHELTSASSDDRARFHYADARLEPNVLETVLPMRKDVAWLMNFYSKIDSSAKLIQVLDCFLFSKDFAPDIRQLFGPSAPIVDAALSSITVDGKRCRVHKIAKQFYKLPTALRTPVLKYFRDRLARIKTFMSEVCGYDIAGHMANGGAERTIAESGAPSLEGSMLMEMLQKRLHWYFATGDAASSLMYVGCTILMDAYLLCRLLHYAVAHGPTSCAIVYAGDAHIEHYADFFVNYLHIKPALCSPMRPETLTEGITRCVDVDINRKAADRCPDKDLRQMFPGATASALSPAAREKRATKAKKGDKGAPAKGATGRKAKSATAPRHKSRET